MGPHLERRTFLAKAVASTTVFGMPATLKANDAVPSKLGLVTYCQRIRQSQLRKKSPSYNLFDPFVFLEHCRQLGAGGMQVGLGVMDTSECVRLKDLAAKHGMFVEAIVSVPKRKSDIGRFKAEMKTASQVGVSAVRTTIIPGRRYEYFESLEQFRAFEKRGREALERVAPIAEQFRVPIAVENHKDHRNEERIALLEHIGSAFVGACVDTGNSMALLEDPIETVKAFAPWAHSVHLKDQAVQPYEDGFLLADIPLGQGCLDLRQMVAILRRAKPKVRFNLELITRDPLEVPTHREEYWSTFPDLPAKDLARTLRTVRDKPTDNLQYISRMNDTQKLAREDQNVRASLSYARRELNL